MKVIDTPVGGADSSLVDMVAITLHVSGGTRDGTGNSGQQDQQDTHANLIRPTFTTSSIDVAVYSASTQLNTAGDYNVTSYFATDSINASGRGGVRTITVTPSTPLASTVKVSCLANNGEGVAGDAVACAVHITDAHGNPAGNDAHVASFLATVTDATGQPLQASIVHDVFSNPLGTYAVQFVSNRSGLINVAVR
jgi:hypothetical protein